MDYKQFSPGVHKLIHHLSHLNNIVAGKHIAPIHISVWPTINCQFNCSYCCCKYEADKDVEIGISEYKKAMLVLREYGTKAVEFSGGGEPTLWTHFNEGVTYTHGLGIKLSLITNGINIHEIPENILNKFEWVRISLQSIKHAKSLKLKELKARINCSFIVSEENDLLCIEDLYSFSKENNLIVRVATKKPCPEILEKESIKVISQFKDHVFFSDKRYGKPLGCYMAWVRAAIDWRGNFLPCPSIHLNEEHEGKIPEDFPLCHIRDIKDWIKNNFPHDLGYRCKLCNCGKEHNDLIFNLLNGVEDVDFV